MKAQYHICSNCGHRALLNTNAFLIEDNSLNFYCPECMNIDMGVELKSDDERINTDNRISKTSDMKRFRSGDILVMESCDFNSDDMIFIYKGYDDGGIKRFYSTAMVNEKTYRFPHYDYGRYLVTKREIEAGNPVIRYATNDEIEALKRYLDEDSIVWDPEYHELIVVDNE